MWEEHTHLSGDVRNLALGRINAMLEEVCNCIHHVFKDAKALAVKSIDFNELDYVRVEKAAESVIFRGREIP